MWTGRDLSICLPLIMHNLRLMVSSDLQTDEDAYEEEWSEEDIHTEGPWEEDVNRTEFLWDDEDYTHELHQRGGIHFKSEDLRFLLTFAVNSARYKQAKHVEWKPDEEETKETKVENKQKKEQGQSQQQEEETGQKTESAEQMKEKEAELKQTHTQQHQREGEEKGREVGGAPENQTVEWQKERKWGKVTKLQQTKQKAEEDEKQVKKEEVHVQQAGKKMKGKEENEQAEKREEYQEHQQKQQKNEKINERAVERVYVKVDMEADHQQKQEEEMMKKKAPGEKRMKHDGEDEQEKEKNKENHQPQQQWQLEKVEKNEQQQKQKEGGKRKEKKGEEDKQIQDVVEQHQHKQEEGNAKKEEDNQQKKKAKQQQTQQLQEDAEEQVATRKDQEKRKIKELQQRLQKEKGVKDEALDEQVEKMKAERQQQEEADWRKKGKDKQADRKTGKEKSQTQKLQEDGKADEREMEEEDAKEKNHQEREKWLRVEENKGGKPPLKKQKISAEEDDQEAHQVEEVKKEGPKKQEKERRAEKQQQENAMKRMQKRKQEKPENEEETEKKVKNQTQEKKEKQQELDAKQQEKHGSCEKRRPGEEQKIKTMVEWEEDMGAEHRQTRRDEKEKEKGEDQMEKRKLAEKDHDERQAMKTQERKESKKKMIKKKDNTLETNTDRHKAETQQCREEERGGEQQTQGNEGEDHRQRQQDEKKKEDDEETSQQNSGEKEPPPLLQQEKHKHQQVKTGSDWQKQEKEEQGGENMRQGKEKEKIRVIKKEDEKMQEKNTQEEEKEEMLEVENPGRQINYCNTTSQHQRPGLKCQDFSWRAVNELVLLVVLLCGSLVFATPVSVSLHVEGWGRTLQGENYSLVCVVTPPQAAHTSPAFSWYRNGKQLDHQTNQVLRLRPLTKSDEGDYRCHLKTEDATSVLISPPFSLNVIVLENISLVPEVEVEEGQTVTLNCSVHSDPTAFLTWRLGGKTLYTVRSNSDSLVLHNASQYHLQIVECEAYNNGLILGFLDAYSLIRLKGTYEVVPTPHLFWKGDMVLHHRFALECIVGEIPNQGVNVHLTYTWYKDDKVMEGQSDMILDFPSLRKEDRGLYTCTARNGKPRTTSLQSKAMEVVVLIPPIVHIEPRPPDNVITQAAGETLTLTCEVTEAFPGVAPDGYRWSYLPSPGGQLRPLEGRESTLTLGPLTRQDSGQYICQAWNYEDFDGLLPPGNASVTVDIWYLKDITLTPDLEVNERDHVTLTCSVDSDPAARLSWLVEGQEVRHVAANVDHYVLERAACSDSKTYTCRASNTHLPGLELMKSCHVLVQCQEKDEDLAQFSVSTSAPANNGAQVLTSSPSLVLAVAIPVSISAFVIIVIV